MELIDIRENENPINKVALINEKLRIEKLPTAITADKYPIHKWFNFVAGYSPEYVKMVISDYVDRNGEKPKKMLDPFSGCATTNVVANSCGITSLGIERNPFFYKIGYTKTFAKETLKYIDEVIFDFSEIINSQGITNNISKCSDPVRIYLLKMFSEDILEKLLEIRNRVLSYKGDKYYMGYTFLSKMLEYITTAKTDGIYKVPTSVKKGMSMVEALIKTEEVMKDGKDETMVGQSCAEYVFASCIDYDFGRKNTDLVVFSPPYLNNFDFAEMTRMQLYFWDEASSWAEISEKHRNHMLVNTTTALKLVRASEKQEILKKNLPVQLQALLEPVVENLSNIYKEGKSKEYYLIIYPYLAQMKKVLEKIFNCLRKRGEIHIVVSDAAFYGIHIDTQEYLAIILEEIGFTDIHILRMRDRGERWKLDKREKSNKKLGEFEIVARKG